MAKKRKKEGKKLSLKLIDEHRKKVVHLIQKGNFNKANSQLNSLRKKLANKHELLAESLVHISEKISDYEIKMNFLEEATSVLNDYGIELCKLNKYESAVEKYEQALKIKSDDFKVLSNYGIALDKLGQYEASIEKYERALNINSHNAAVLSNYGNVLSNLCRYESAIEKYEQALNIKPDDVEALISYGAMLGFLGHYELAIEKYERALEVKPNDTDILTNYGIILTNYGQYDVAIEQFTQVFKLTSDDSYKTLCCYIWALIESGQYESAIEQIEKALRIKPDDYEVLTNYGAVLFYLGQYQSAIKKYEQALGIKPDHTVILRNCGVTLAMSGNYEAAIEKFEQVLATASEYDNFLFLGLGWLYYRIKSENQGNKYFELAIEHSEDKDAERIRVAQHIFSVNPYSQDGVDILREITETSPDYSEAFNMLSLNLSLKEYWQMFNTRSDAASLHDNEMLNRAIYHKIKNEISILKDIVYEIISDYQDTDSIFSGIIDNINSVFRGIEQRRNKEKEQVKEFPNDDYEKIIKIISDTAHDINDFVNNELAIIEADIRDILSNLSTEESPYQELQELLAQIKITQGALNDLKNINQGIKIRYTRFQVKELFQNWANNRKLQNATISLGIDNSESVFNGDDQKIKSFLNEMVENSIKHNSDKEDLEIRIGSKNVINPPEIRGKDIPGEQKFLVISCNDNGKGIPSDKKKTIFLPLETTSNFSSGLGLFIIKRTLQEMNGYIRESGENGANFEIFIPYSNGESEWTN